MEHEALTSAVSAYDQKQIETKELMDDNIKNRERIYRTRHDAFS